MNYVDKDMVEEFINFEIEDLENILPIDEELQKDEIEYLKNLSEDDIADITQKVNDDEELQDKINELIKYWIYHR